MHKFSTAATKSSALTVLRSLMLLAVPYSTPAVPSLARLVRSALSSLRDENLCIIRARSIQSMCIHCSRQKMGADVNVANANGRNPLHAAGVAGANKLVPFLLENGTRVDVQDRCGQTPSSLAQGKDLCGVCWIHFVPTNVRRNCFETWARWLPA